MSAAVAGPQAARGADDLEIVAFERGHFTSYSACGIPYWIGGVVTDRDALVARTPARFREARHRRAHPARGGRHRPGPARGRRARPRGRAAARSASRFDHLVYAAGAVPVAPHWARVDAGGVFGVQTLDDGTAIHDWLDRDPTPAHRGGGRRRLHRRRDGRGPGAARPRRHPRREGPAADVDRRPGHGRDRSARRSAGWASRSVPA